MSFKNLLTKEWPEHRQKTSFNQIQTVASKIYPLPTMSFIIFWDF